MFGQQAPLNRFVAMLAIYVVTSFIIWTLFRFVSGAIDKVRLESFDKQLGAMFGFAKGVLLCVAITFFAVTLLPQPQGEAIVGSQSGRYIVALLDKVAFGLPAGDSSGHRSVSQQGRTAAESELPAARPGHAASCGRTRCRRTRRRAGRNFRNSVGRKRNRRNRSRRGRRRRNVAAAAGVADVVAGAAGMARATGTAENGRYRDPYALPREPQPFPGPYSAEVPASRDY